MTKNADEILFIFVILVFLNLSNIIPFY